MAGVFDTEVSTAGVPISALIASMCRSAQRVTLADRTALYTRDMICVNDSALSLLAESLDTGPKGVSSI